MWCRKQGRGRTCVVQGRPRRSDGGTQRLVSYLVRTTPPGNVRVSTRASFTRLSRAVKNGVPPPTKTGAVASTYSSISPARMAAAARVAPPMSMGPPSSALSRVISVTASPVTRRVFQSTVLVVEENTTFGMSRHRRAETTPPPGGPRRLAAPRPRGGIPFPPFSPSHPQPRPPPPPDPPPTNPAPRRAPPPR